MNVISDHTKNIESFRLIHGSAIKERINTTSYNLLNSSRNTFAGYERYEGKFPKKGNFRKKCSIREISRKSQHRKKTIFGLCYELIKEKKNIQKTLVLNFSFFSFSVTNFFIYWIYKNEALDIHFPYLTRILVPVLPVFF